jgi:phage tail protein X
MASYRTIDGDMLDAICLDHYGQVTGVEEIVLAANPTLAEIGPVLPAGIIIDLPDMPSQQETVDIVRLWD